MSRIIMHRGDIGLELVKQERATHQLSSSDLIGCGSSSSAIADGEFILYNTTVFLPNIFWIFNKSSKGTSVYCY